MENELKKEDNPEFHALSACPFYSIETGRTSLYGDQTFIALESLVEQNDIDIADYSERLFNYYGPGSECEKAKNEEGYPKHGPWTPGPIKTFLSKYKTDPVTGDEKGTDMHTTTAIIPVVAKYAGQPEMLAKARKIIKVTSTNTEAIAFGLAGARLLEQYILHGEDPKAIDTLMHTLKSSNSMADAQVVKHLENVLKETDKSHDNAGRDFGIACGYPGVFQTAVHGLLTYSNYVSAVRGTLCAGGDNCSRAMFIGACKAAEGGLGCIPEEWKQKTSCHQNLLEMAQKLVEG
ncbi:crystallin J1A-like isoform X2 [Glandiceps talaboti]